MPMPAGLPIASDPIAFAPDALTALPTLPVLPSLLGQAFPIIRKPMWRTRKPEAISGQQTARADWPFPRYQWTLAHSVLREGNVSGQVLAEMSTLYNFFMFQQGGWNAWLYKDQDDNTVTSQVIAITDGVSTVYPLCRAFGGSVERILQLDPSMPYTLYLDGVAQPASSYTVTDAVTLDAAGPGMIKFSTTYAAGVTISMDYSYYWLCRFVEDQCLFEEFLSGYHKVDALTFNSVYL